MTIQFVTYIDPELFLYWDKRKSLSFIQRLYNSEYITLEDYEQLKEYIQSTCR